MPETATTRKDYWISTSPFFETSFFSACPVEGEALLVLRDCDGACFNEVTLSFQPGVVSVLELDPLMAACKLESGFKHAYLEARLPSQATAIARLQTTEGAAIIPELSCVSEGRGFFPFQLGGLRTTLLALVNLFEGESQVRARFICANRSPEVTWVLPPKAIKLFDLRREFGSYVELAPGTTAQAYLRFGSKSGTALGYQVVERVQGPKEGNLFATLG